MCCECLCEDCCGDCCQDGTIAKNLTTEVIENEEKEEEREELILLEDKNLDKLNGNEILAIKKYISLKLNKSEQYSIKDIDNCEESTHKCKKITLNNGKNEEFILFIKEDKDPTFVFESLKMIEMSEIDYVYYNGYLVTSKVDGDVYKNGYDFDFKNIKNLNVYRFFCALLGCTDCEPFRRIDNIYIKNNNVFLLDFLSHGYSKVENLEEFLSIPKISINEPRGFYYFKSEYLNIYNEEDEIAFWFSIKEILCRIFGTEIEYYDEALNDGKEIEITYFLSFLKDYIKTKYGIEDKQILPKLKEEMNKNTFTNEFISFLEKEEKENLPTELENAKGDKITVFEKKINDATSILEKIQNGKKVEDLYNEELKWGRKIVKHMKNLLTNYDLEIKKMKESYKILDQEKEKINEKLPKLINFYQSNEGKNLIEKYQENFRFVVSYLSDILEIEGINSFINNETLDVISNFNNTILHTL